MGRRCYCLTCRNEEACDSACREMQVSTDSKSAKTDSGMHRVGKHRLFSFRSLWLWPPDTPVPSRAMAHLPSTVSAAAWQLQLPENVG